MKQIQTILFILFFLNILIPKDTLLYYYFEMNEKINLLIRFFFFFVFLLQIKDNFINY
jgi:hypothetical protein